MDFSYLQNSFFFDTNSKFSQSLKIYIKLDIRKIIKGLDKNPNFKKENEDYRLKILNTRKLPNQLK